MRFAGLTALLACASLFASTGISAPGPIIAAVPLSLALVAPDGDCWDDMANLMCGGGAGLTLPGTPRALHWAVAIRNKATGQVTTVSSEDATFNYSIQPSWLGIEVHFFDIQSPALPPDVHIEVDARFGWAGDFGLVAASLDAELSGPGVGNASIYSVTFPIVEVNALPEDKLTWPIGTGVVLDNALVHPLTGLLSNFTRHPGQASMQWWCLFADESTPWHPTFYMSTRDTEGVYKEYIPKPVVEGLRFSVRQIPPDNLNVTNYEAPFETVFGVVFDDWYAAANRYRKWAEQQPWTGQGPMRQDARFSTAIRDMTMFGLVAPDVDFNSWLPWPDRHAEQTALFGTSEIVPQNYGWYDHGFDLRFGDWKPLPQYLQVAAQVAAQGVKFSPYTVVHEMSRGSEPLIPGYDPATMEALYGLRRENGQVELRLDAEGQLAWTICQSTTFARDYVTWLAGKLQSYGASGMYLDVLNALPPQLCYATGHGHDPADPLNTRRRTDITKAIADQSLDPQFYVTSESVNEMYLGELEMGMSQWTRNLLGELVSYYPLFETVYHRYLRIGRLGVVLNFDTQKLPPLLFQLLSRQTYAAHIFSGWTPFAGALLNDDSLTDNMAASPLWASFIEMVQRYMGFLIRPEIAEHVTYGQRLRDPDATVATVDLGFLGVLLRLLTIPYGPVQPAVYTSAWGSPEQNSILLLAENWTDESDGLFANTIALQSLASMSAESLGFDPLWFEEYNFEDQPVTTLNSSNVQQMCLSGGGQAYSMTFRPQDSGFYAKNWEVWRYSESGSPVLLGKYKGSSTIALSSILGSRHIEAFLLKPKY